MKLRLNLTNFDKRKWNGVVIDLVPKNDNLEMTYVKLDKHGNPIRFGEKEFILIKEI